MIINILIVGIVLGLAYAWMVRGFFNAFIHLLCVLVSGAVAFALWEPLSFLIMGLSPERGFLSFIESAAWGLGLLIPFSVCLLLTRVLTDKVIKANLTNATAADYAGGAVCGLGVGVITAGVFVIGTQSLRLPTNLGFRPVWYSEDRTAGAGSLVYTNRLWIPADRITASVYRGLSEGSMSSSESLAKWQPNLEVSGFAARISPGDGAGRNIIDPDDFRITKVYTIGTPDRPVEARELLTLPGSAAPQRYVDVRGRAPGADGLPSKGVLMGVVIEFSPGAKESGRGGGQLIVSNGQIQMIARNQTTSESVMLFPLAAISENIEADGRLGRWMFDSNDVYISSVGASSQPVLGFEFLVPEGYEPIGLSVRQTRRLARDFPEPVALASTAERDARVASGAIFRAEGARTVRQRDASNAVTIPVGTTEQLAAGGVIVGNSIGDVTSSQTARSRVTLDEENQIADGQAKFDLAEIGRGNVPPGRSMRVDTFALGRNQTMVQIDVSAGMPASFLSEAARLASTSDSLVLIDTNGNEYQAIGFIYRDREIFELRYTLGNTLGGVTDTPPISTARDDQRLVILFVVTTGAEVEQFAIGDTVIARFEPALWASTGRRP